MTVTSKKCRSVDLTRNKHLSSASEFEEHVCTRVLHHYRRRPGRRQQQMSCTHSSDLQFHLGHGTNLYRWLKQEYNRYTTGTLPYSLHLDLNVGGASDEV